MSYGQKFLFNCKSIVVEALRAKYHFGSLGSGISMAQFHLSGHLDSATRSVTGLVTGLVTGSTCYYASLRVT